MQQFTGLQYLKMDIASAFGLDKKTWAERLQWFADNEAQLLADVLGMAKQAKEPAQLVAGVMAYQAALNGEPTGYLCGLDATSSGLQLLAILSGCSKSAEICNLIDTGNREDAYSIVHSRVEALLGGACPVDAKQSKQALMTHLYGSKAVPEEVYGTDTSALRAFYTAINEELPGANQLNHDLLSLWNPEALAHEWTLPDGFDVRVKVMDTITHSYTFLGRTYESREHVNRPKAEGLSIGANVVHSIDGMVVREMNRRCNYDPMHVGRLLGLLSASSVGGVGTLRQKDLCLLRVLELADATGFMPAVVFEYIDEFNVNHLSDEQKAIVIDLINSLPEKPFHLLCIHDCFKFHANNGNAVREQYRNILVELAASEIMSNIASQIAGRHINVTKLDPGLPARIAQSEYAIC